MTINILFLAANPKDTEPLRLGEEMRAIQEKLRVSEYREDFRVEQEWAVRVGDIQGHLMRHKPHIVHFSGHGSTGGGIILESQDGHSRSVAPPTLKRLFATLKDNIRCVVLNACFSSAQAEAITESIDCVVGMSAAIPDKVAIVFAASFYQALGFGRSVQTAFDSACLEIELENLGEQDVPRLLTGSNVHARMIYVLSDIQSPPSSYSRQPSILESEAAGRFLTFAEDRRVLVALYEYEYPEPVIASILKIREQLTNEMLQLNHSSVLYECMAGMRKACRVFLDNAQGLELRWLNESGTGRMARLYAQGFFAALGQLRNEFWTQIRKIIETYEIEIDQELAGMLPKESAHPVKLTGRILFFERQQIPGRDETRTLGPTFLLLQYLDPGKPTVYRKHWLLEGEERILELLQSLYDREEEVTITGEVYDDTERVKVISVESTGKRPGFMNKEKPIQELSRIFDVTGGQHVYYEGYYEDWELLRPYFDK